MLVRKYQWMGMVSLILTLLLLSDSLIVRATEAGTLIGDGTNEVVEQYTVDDEEIWALIDRDELRSSIDVDALKDTMDLSSLRRKIDTEALLQQISDINLLNGMSAEEILKEYNSLKEAETLDEFIKDIVEAEGFDEDFIKNHPVDVPSVTVPIVGGVSPLDYILDPQELIYQTQAVRYGGGNVKEGANVLFKNTDGEYLFSDTSDMLEIVNKGNVPLQVTISAKIENPGGVQMVDSGSMLVGNDPGIFMALVGDEGILSVINDTGSSEVTIVLKAVPEGTYEYTINEETGEYESQLSENADESAFDSFKFAVTGKCNASADWSRVSELPKIIVSWKTEPILTDWDKVNEELEEADKVKFEAFKKAKLEVLRREELERLIQIQIDDMIYDELDALIDEEVERLAQARFEELKELAIRGELDLQTGEIRESDGMLILDDENAAGSEGDAGVESDAEVQEGEGSEDAADGAAENGDADGTNESGADASAKAGGNGAVLGARREQIEFIESSDDGEVVETSDDTEIIESPEDTDIIKSSDDAEIIESSDGAEIIESSDEGEIIEFSSEPETEESTEQENVIFF